MYVKVVLISVASDTCQFKWVLEIIHRQIRTEVTLGRWGVVET